MKYLLFYFVVLITLTSLQGQPQFDYYRDQQWVLGYNPTSIGYDSVYYKIFDFSGNDLNLRTRQGLILQIVNTNGTICDENGDILLFSNGCGIMDSSFHILSGGTEINSGNFYNYSCGQHYEGYAIPDGMTILPLTANEMLLLYLNIVKTDNYPLIRNLFAAQV